MCIKTKLNGCLWVCKLQLTKLFAFCISKFYWYAYSDISQQLNLYSPCIILNLCSKYIWSYESLKLGHLTLHFSDSWHLDLINLFFCWIGFTFFLYIQENYVPCFESVFQLLSLIPSIWSWMTETIFYTLNKRGLRQFMKRLLFFSQF